MIITLTYQRFVEQKYVRPLGKCRFIAILVLNHPMAADCVFVVLRKMRLYRALHMVRERASMRQYQRIPKFVLYQQPTIALRTLSTLVERDSALI